MSHFDLTDCSHRRFNPLTGTYVLCSPHRAKRPWLGAKENAGAEKKNTYEPGCYLCPGNKRAVGNAINPKYSTTFIFPNDFSAVKLDQPDYVDEDSKGKSEEEKKLRKRLLITKGVRGKCFVICFSPNHALTMPLLTVNEIVGVINAWLGLYTDLKRQHFEEGKPYKYVQIFENKGAAMGCSNPHPHCQSWCLDTIPTEISRELSNLIKYKAENGTHLFADYIRLEQLEKVRIVLENDSFIVVVPYWALWPFETLLIAKEHLRSLEDFDEKHKEDLASILKKLTVKYDNLFETSFPYSAGLHQAPFFGSEDELDCSWFHAHFYPPLLRSATVKKFCVGFEMLAEPQRDLTSEQAAAKLQQLDSETHYSQRK